MKTITNKEASAYVRDTRPFINNNRTLFAENLGDLYVVFSYGHHWPLYIHDRTTQLWYCNKDKYSPTTSRHQSQTNTDQECIPLMVEQLRAMIDLTRHITPATIENDQRYTIQREFAGSAEPQWVVRFCGDSIYAHLQYTEAMSHAVAHEIQRQIA